MLTDHEKDIAQQSKCFLLIGCGAGTEVLGLTPHGLVAKARGSEFKAALYGIGDLVPMTKRGLINLSQAAKDIARWLGLDVSEYLRLLPIERERIFQRAQQ